MYRHLEQTRDGGRAYEVLHEGITVTDTYGRWQRLQKHVIMVSTKHVSASAGIKASTFADKRYLQVHK